MRNTGQSGQREMERESARVPEFLIANLVEFHVSPIRISNLNFSNRKLLAIFPLKLVTDGEPCAAFSSPQPSASNLQNLIVTPRLESLATRSKQTPNQNPNRYKSRFSRRGCISGMPSLPARRSREPALVGPFANHRSSTMFSPASCIAPPPRLTWRLATLPPRSSADAIQSQSFAIHPDAARTRRFRNPAFSCKPASNRRSSGATSRGRRKSAKNLEAGACSRRHPRESLPLRKRPLDLRPPRRLSARRRLPAWLPARAGNWRRLRRRQPADDSRHPARLGIFPHRRPPDAVAENRPRVSSRAQRHRRWTPGAQSKPRSLRHRRPQCVRRVTRLLRSLGQRANSRAERAKNQQPGKLQRVRRQRQLDERSPDRDGPQ